MERIIEQIEGIPEFQQNCIHKLSMNGFMTYLLSGQFNKAIDSEKLNFISQVNSRIFLFTSSLFVKFNFIIIGSKFTTKSLLG